MRFLVGFESAQTFVRNIPPAHELINIRAHWKLCFYSVPFLTFVLNFDPVTSIEYPVSHYFLPKFLVFPIKLNILVSQTSSSISSISRIPTLHEKTPLHKIKCVVKSVLKATFDTPLITFDSRQRWSLILPLTRIKGVKGHIWQRLCIHLWRAPKVIFDAPLTRVKGLIKGVRPCGQIYLWLASKVYQRCTRV